MKHVLLTDACRFSQQQTDSIGRLGFKIFICSDNAQRIQEAFLCSQAVVCNRLLLAQDIDNFPDLQFIQLTCSGLDHVPVEKIRHRGIVLCNDRGVYSITIAEWVLLKILELYKNSRYFHEAQRSASGSKTESC